MKRRSINRPQPTARRNREKDSPDTRQQLLEAAGQVFAEKGYDRATGKEICERAGANSAAVNYHYGGMEGLYTAVLLEAHNRLVTLETLSAVAAGTADAKSKLQSIIGMLIEALTGPVSSSWVLRVLGREIVSPSPAVVELREKAILPKARVLQSIVSELMGLPVGHPAVARGCVSVIAPCVLLLIGDRGIFKRVFPNFGFDQEDAGAVAHHMTEYALAGLAAVARDAREEASNR